MHILFLILSFLFIVLFLFTFSLVKNFSTNQDKMLEIHLYLIKISVGLFVALFFSLLINIVCLFNISGMTEEISIDSKRITEWENQIEYSKQLIEYSK